MPRPNKTETTVNPAVSSAGTLAWPLGVDDPMRRARDYLLADQPAQPCDPADVRHWELRLTQAWRRLARLLPARPTPKSSVAA